MAKQIPSIHSRNMGVKTIIPSHDDEGYWGVDTVLPRGYPLDVTPSQSFNDVEFTADLGRGKWASYKWDDAMEATGDYGGDLAMGGRMRTPGRAKIAAEAMTKRIEEGRNLKTGRPLE